MLGEFIHCLCQALLRLRKAPGKVFTSDPGTSVPYDLDGTSRAWVYTMLTVTRGLPVCSSGLYRRGLWEEQVD